MKIYFITIVFIIIVPGLQPEKKEKDKIFDQLYALEGKWLMKTKNGAIGEEWTKINDDYLQNRGYIIKGFDTMVTERIALRNTQEGIFYISTVEDQNNKLPVSFKLTSTNNNIFVFENPDHDFPRRISYSFINKDSLYAWIDDGKEIPEKKSAFRYSRQR